MKTQELRIGNIIIKDNEEIIVSPYDMINLELGLNDYNPIFLTEEWLVKYGFENEYGKEWSNYSEKRDDYIVLENRDGKFYYSAGEGIKLSKPIKHVHQLQNLYFALTNTEIDF